MWKAISFFFLCAFCAHTASAATWQWARDGKMQCEGKIIRIGISESGGPAYMARIHEGPSLVPGFTLLDDKPGGYMAFNGNAYSSNNYEVLCGDDDIAWQHINTVMGSKIPLTALPAGQLEDGTQLYACRTLVTGKDGNYLSGFVDPATQLCNTSVSVPPSQAPNWVFVPAQTAQYEIMVAAPSPSPNKYDFFWEWSDPDEPNCPGKLVEFGSAPGKIKRPLALARIHYGQYVLPGFVPDYPNLKTAYFTINSTTVRTSNSFEVLCGDGFAWHIISSKSVLPNTARVAVGQDPKGRPIFVCRVSTLYSDSEFVSGMIDPDTDECIYMMRGGGENPVFDHAHSTKNYEVFVSADKLTAKYGKTIQLQKIFNRQQPHLTQAAH